jgi:hypothetical protein
MTTIPSGYKNFQRAEVLDVDDLNGYLQRQSVMVFDTEIDRNSQLALYLRPGITTYIKSTGLLETYDGAVWNSYPYYDTLTNPFVADEILKTMYMDTPDASIAAPQIPVLFYQIFQNYVDGRWDINIWS